MKTTPYLFALIFVGTLFYLGLNNFQFPTIFLFTQTEKVKGTVTEVHWVNYIKGSKIQSVTYEYQVEDSIYTDKFRAGKLQGIQSKDDHLLIEYSVDSPHRNKVVGFYRQKKKGKTSNKN